MSVSIPQPFVTVLTGGISTTLAGGVNIGTPTPLSANATVSLTDSELTANLTGIPTAFSITDLPEIKLGITSLPEVRLGMTGPIELKLTELPKIRAHLPAAFNVGLSVLGVELMNVRLCGEAQMITEPYEPNPCEPCDRRGFSIKDAVFLVEKATQASASDDASAPNITRGTD